MVQGGPAVQVGVIVVTILGLWVGARLLVDAVVRLARRFGISDLAIGLTVVAMGTSTPELAVSVDAALKGLGDIAVANVLGSNIYNLAFILGVISLLRVIPIAEPFVRRDGVALLAATAVGGLAVLDLTITRAEGAVLAGLFVVYTVYLLRRERTTAAGTAASASTAAGSAASASTAGSSSERASAPGGAASGVVPAVVRLAPERETFRPRDAAFLVGGLALVLVSGDYMVLAASSLARGAGISDWVIGGTIVAAGTSTPEFAVSLVAIRRGSLGVSVGNVVGSNIYNVTGIMGVAAVLRPLAVSGTALETLAWLAGITVLMVGALWTERVLSRLEGALFVASEVGRWVLGILGLLG